MLGSAPVGLTSAQARRLLDDNGPNHLPVQRPMPWWRVLGAEMLHFFAVLFWAAGVLAFVAGLPQLGVAIFVVIVLNALFAFAQEARAQRASEKLRQMLPRRARVIRDGISVEINAEDLVVGDAMLLAEGDRISADGEIHRAAGLAVDTSAMTGESVPERPGVADAVYAGCFVVEGEALVVVTATGDHTRLAGIAGLTSERQLPTPLRRELTRASRVIAGAALGVGAVFFAFSVIFGMPVAQGFLFAIGVTVAVVPEGLLPTVTLSLAMGAQRMARRHALVRHLEAVQTLGSTTYICTDKTGTLTQNRMSVVRAWTPRGAAVIDGVGYQPTADVVVAPEAERAVRDLAAAARRCSTGRIEQADGSWQARGDPMEAALDAFAQRVGVLDTTDDRADQLRFPFDPRRRRMSVVTDGHVCVKGAPDAVLPLCRAESGAHAALTELTGRGLRVLAVAAGRTACRADRPTSPQDVEKDLTLLGLVALEDPPRPSVPAVLRTCRRAGIRVAMVTGDHPDTAMAVARETGLRLEDTDREVLLGSQLPDDLDELGALLDRDGLVVARVDPETKLRIAQALRRRGHVVAMTGDGVNDAPALQAAAIGVAMGRSGTDVARAAADVVLLDDNFATIVTAIEEGRSTFINIRRFLTYHLSDNVAELAPFVVWALSAGRFPLAIGVLQVLALDIGTDVFPALALGAEPPDKRVLDGPPVRGHLLDRAILVRAFLVLGLAEAAVALLAFTATFVAAGWRPGQEFTTGALMWSASGAAFTAIVLGQAANAFACRSDELPAWRLSLRTNALLVGAVAVELVLLLVLLYVPPIATALTHTGPTTAGFLVAALSVPAVLLVDAADKHRRRSRKGPAALARPRSGARR
nr:cation-transporting P-type ATPase [Mycolicibacterium duvalii]